MLSAVAARTPTSELLPLLYRMRKSRRRSLPPITPLTWLLKHSLMLPWVPWTYYPLTPTPWAFPRLCCPHHRIWDLWDPQVHSTLLGIILLLPHPERWLPLPTDSPPHTAVRRTLGFGNKMHVSTCFYSSPVYCYLYFSPAPHVPLPYCPGFSLPSPFAIVHVQSSQVHPFCFPLASGCRQPYFSSLENYAAGS